MPWVLTGAICSVFVALGMLLDRLSTRVNKKKIHDILLLFWEKVDNTTVPQFPNLAAQWTLSVMEKNFTTKKRWIIFILCFVVISVFLTSQAFAIGATMYGSKYDTFLLFKYVHQYPSKGLFVISMNVIFHVITAVGTYFFISKILEAERNYKKIVKYCFMYLLLNYVVVIEKAFGILVIANNGWSLSNLYSGMYYLRSNSFWVEKLYALNLSIPIGIYLVLILLLFPLKFVITVGIWLVKKATEVEVEKLPKDIAPFSLLGLFFGLLAALAKVIDTIIH